MSGDASEAVRAARPRETRDGLSASLGALRAELAICTDDASLAALADRLAGDVRSGARALLARVTARRVALARERDRMAGLLALRDRLAADGVTGIAGVDEVGVGPLAGPVVAAAVVLPSRVELPGLDDSKRVPPARREQLASAIRAGAVGYGIGEVSSIEIDRLGIYHAGLEAMRRAVAALARIVEPGHLLVDARVVPGFDRPQTAIVHGDALDASIAAASIVAKVHRDALMRALAVRHPAYGFERHMGYGTAEHLRALDRFGPCPAHRRSFAPVAEAERRARARGPECSA